MTSDDYEYDADGKLVNNSFNYIKTLRIISSDDMVNWTDHGEIKVAGNDGAANGQVTHGHRRSPINRLMEKISSSYTLQMMRPVSVY